MSMKRWAPEVAQGNPIEGVADDGQTVESQLRPDLMLSPREQFNLEGRMTWSALQTSIAQPGLFTFWVALDATSTGPWCQIVDQFRSLSRLPDDPSKVALLDRALCEGLTQATRSLGGLAEDDEPGDIAVQSMNKAHIDVARLVVAVPNIVASSFQEAIITCLRSLSEQARRLLYNQQMVVLEHNLKR